MSERTLWGFPVVVSNDAPQNGFYLTNSEGDIIAWSGQPTSGMLVQMASQLTPKRYEVVTGTETPPVERSSK